MLPNRFAAPVYVALDFETSANNGPCACSIGMARFEEGKLVEEYYSLIKPPSPKIMYSKIHGLCWKDLKNANDFAVVWEEAAYLLKDAIYIVAHNAPFDRRVLRSCCDYYNSSYPLQSFLCTLKGSRRALSIESFSLAAVSGYFGFELEHHNAASDARNCGRILGKLFKMGLTPSDLLCP